MAAAANGRTDAVKELLKAGADVNAKMINGYTALMFAAEQGHDDTVASLLSAGAEVNVRNSVDNDTALSLAEGAGRTSTVRLPKKAGAVE